MKTLMQETSITALHREYLPQVMEIEEGNSLESNPLAGKWKRKDFLEVLAHPNHQGMVAWSGKKIVGFAIYSLSYEKIHICNMAVHPDYLNQGIGSQIIMKFKSKLRPKRRTSIDIDIRESNLRAHLFLRNRGFKAICVCRNWYEAPCKEDAYKFQYKLE